MGRTLLASHRGRIRLDVDPRDQASYTIGYGNHHMGTTRMSEDPKTGVVDANCRVHGLSNLYIAGSSVFPTSGAANPTLTLVALACAALVAECNGNAEYVSATTVDEASDALDALQAAVR